MRKLIAAIVLLLAATAAASAQNTVPYMSGTGGLTSGNLVKSGSTVGQLQDAGVTPNKLMPLTYGAGQNLATNALPIGVVGASAGTVTSVVCVPTAQVGATAHLQVWKAASGSSPTTTKINTTDCDANGGTLNTTQTMGVTNASLTAGDIIYVVATGTWTSSAGAGVVQVTLLQ